DAHVIDQHRRRKDHVRLRIAVEMATHRKIKNHEERLIQNRRTVLREVAARDRVVRDIVDEERRAERVPFDGEDMVVAREGTLPQRETPGEGCRARVAGAVNRRAGNSRLASLVLHDVELSARRPADGGKVMPKHPERWPQTLPLGQLDPRFDAPRFREHLAARVDLGGSVEARPVVALEARRSRARYDYQLALTIEGDVAWRVGVILLLAVAPAAVPLIAAIGLVVAPLGLVDPGTSDAIEFVAPDQRPGGLR